MGTTAAQQCAPVGAGGNHGGHRHVGVAWSGCELALGLADTHSGLLATHEAFAGAAGAGSLAGLHLGQELSAVTCLGNQLNARVGGFAAAPEGEPAASGALGTTVHGGSDPSLLCSYQHRHTEQWVAAIDS